MTAGYDGKVKMWDLRNQTEPLSAVKVGDQKDQKMFATCWNGPSQILSGGSSSTVFAHEIA